MTSRKWFSASSFLSQPIQSGCPLLIKALAAVGALLMGVPAPSGAETRITLKRSFVEAFKNKATITATATIDHVKDSPNTISNDGKDGDLHASARAPEVGLPFVAEIMNARMDTEAQDLLRAASEDGHKIQVTGAWRIWMEHGGGSDQVQGQPVAPAEDTNPDHVFEIHSITHIGDHDLGGTFVPIPNFTAYPAEEAFPKYESVRCVITPHKASITLATGMAGYNYAEFTLKAQKPADLTEDGYLLLADVYNDDDELVVRGRRMVFVKGTPPEDRVKDLKKGDKLHVLGIPRIDLALVSWRVAHATERPDALRWSLPYEMIIVGIYP